MLSLHEKEKEISSPRGCGEQLKNVPQGPTKGTEIRRQIKRLIFLSISIFLEPDLWFWNAWVGSIGAPMTLSPRVSLNPCVLAKSQFGWSHSVYLKSSLGLSIEYGILDHCSKFLEWSCALGTGACTAYPRQFYTCVVDHRCVSTLKSSLTYSSGFRRCLGVFIIITITVLISVQGYYWRMPEYFFPGFKLGHGAVFLQK